MREYVNKLSKDLIKSNLPSKSFSDLMRKMGIPHRNEYNAKLLKEKMISENIDFVKIDNNESLKRDSFSVISDKDQCYWLGFIAADGYVPEKGNRVSFTLSVKDDKLLDSFISFINGDHNKKKYFTGQYNNPMVEYTICDKSIADSIKKVGIISPKSKNMPLIKFNNEELDLDYMMGYYDGDGSQDTPVLSSGCKKFLKDVKKSFNIRFKVKII